ncbi:hypothetical protein DFH28DRAFT_332610 [Melampsora americana]|nr:hypothetical protein DFH28DRAFT_332610 [Melampsora americana]
MQDYETQHSIESDQRSHLHYRFSNQVSTDHHHHPLSLEESMRSSSSDQSQSQSHHLTDSSLHEIQKSKSTNLCELEEEEEGSLNESSLESYHRFETLISEILCLDSNGKRLPYNSNQLNSLKSVWNSNLTGNPSNHHQDFDDDSLMNEPIWLKKLRENVLFERNENDDQTQDQTSLVFEIQTNLKSLINQLNQDQWLYASPTAFSPSLSIQSNSLNLGLEGNSTESLNHERYLETDFNLHSLPLSDFSDLNEPNLLPPRQLWLGEEEDKGLESDVSLIDLLNTTPNPNLNRNSNLINSVWDLGRSKRPQRHAQGSALARQVSRLGMSE